MERHNRMKKALFTALDSSNMYIINSKFQTLTATIFHTLKCINILCYRILFTFLWVLPTGFSILAFPYDMSMRMFTVMIVSAIAFLVYLYNIKDNENEQQTKS